MAVVVQKGVEVELAQVQHIINYNTNYKNNIIRIRILRALEPLKAMAVVVQKGVEVALAQV